MKHKGLSRLITVGAALALVGVSAGGVLPANASSKETLTVAYPVGLRI